MRMFQLIFRNGLTRNVEVTGYSKGRRGFVFMTPGGETLRFSAGELTKVEEVLDHAVSVPDITTVTPARMSGSKEPRFIAA